MKKTIFACLVFIFLLVMVTGCKEKEISINTNQTTTAGTNTSKGDEIIELTVVGNLENFEALEHIINLFEAKYGNCNITYVTLNGYQDTIGPRLENTNENTDLYMASSRTDFKPDSAYLKHAVDFNDSNNRFDLSGLNEFLTQSQAIDGKLYMVPLGMNPRGIVVNKKILADNNITMPTNWSEFLSACEKVQQAGLRPIGGYNANNAISIIYPYIANQIVHNPNYETVFASINNFEEGTSEYFRDAFERINTLVTEGYMDYNKNVQIIDGYNSAILDFFEGKTAFSPCTAETVSGMKKREDLSDNFKANPFEYEFYCAPVGDDGAYGYWQVWQGMCVNKDSKNLDWAMKFANFMFEEKNMASLASIKGIPANTKNATDDARYTSLFSIDSSHVAEANQFVNTIYSILNSSVLQKMVLPLEGLTTKDKNGNDVFTARLDVDAAILKYEAKIKDKRD